jgi:hypothetical protein
MHYCDSTATLLRIAWAWHSYVYFSENISNYDYSSAKFVPVWDSLVACTVCSRSEKPSLKCLEIQV